MRVPVLTPTDAESVDWLVVCAVTGRRGSGDGLRNGRPKYCECNHATLAYAISPCCCHADGIPADCFVESDCFQGITADTCLFALPCDSGIINGNRTNPVCQAQLPCNASSPTNLGTTTPATIASTAAPLPCLSSGFRVWYPFLVLIAMSFASTQCLSLRHVCLF